MEVILVFPSRGHYPAVTETHRNGSLRFPKRPARRRVLTGYITIQQTHYFLLLTAHLSCKYLNQVQSTNWFWLEIFTKLFIFQGLHWITLDYRDYTGLHCL